MHSDIHIIQLPAERWNEYKTLRLEGLLESPLAFGKSYEEDSELLEKDWRVKLEEAKGKNHWMYFAEEAGTLLGMIGAYRTPLKRFSHCVNIVSVYVRPEARGRGIATKLFEQIMKEITKDKTVKKLKLIVTATQEAAVALYEKQGFRTVGISQKEFHLDNSYYDEILMEKVL